MNAPRLELDYVAAPRRARWLGVLVLAAGLALAALSVARYRDARDALAVLEPAPPEARAERRPAISGERQREDQERADSVRRQLGLPWSPLLETVEAAARSDVTLLRMQPQAQSRSLLFTAEARDPAAMLDYLRRLGESRMLSGVHLVAHRVRSDDPSHPVRFDVRASLRGAA
ncbi:MAG: hypothetical protein ACREVQ_12070 [Burkholderiales bacterium]